MKIIDRLRSFFFRPPPSTLRNRPGKMAWIQRLDSGDGDHVLNGRAVKTVSCGVDGLWRIDPLQEHVVTRNTFYIALGQFVPAGCIARISAIHDDCLEPWKDIGDLGTEEIEASVPAVPARAPSPVEVS